MMIISASRRTDIPACYSGWFFNRIKEGFVLTRNPRNFHQLSKITLAPDKIGGIVFWTKNPQPMLGRLRELQGYMYYFHFSLTPYGRDIEPNLPPKQTELLLTFKKLSDTIGAERVIWRYDPILINERYTFDYHLRAFSKIAEELRGYTKKVTFSFIDTDYRAVKSNMNALALREFSPSLQSELASKLAEIAHGCGLSIEACAEEIDLRQFGIEKARCIDGELFGRLLGRELKIGKDKNQRPACGCAASVDIGQYNTCLNGCRYCYANYNQNAVSGNFAKHNPLSPLLYGNVEEKDAVSERKLKL